MESAVSLAEEEEATVKTSEMASHHHQQQQYINSKITEPIEIVSIG